MSPILNKESNKGFKKHEANHGNLEHLNISKQSEEAAKGHPPSEAILGPASTKLHNSANANIIHMVPNLKNNADD